MRYVIVNLREPRHEARCPYCAEVIGEGYVRDLSTHIVYDRVGCMEWHIYETEQAMEARHAAM